MNCGDCKYSHDTGTALLCWGQRFAPPVDRDHWCESWTPINPKPQTNADRIRAMSDEELADFLCYWDDCGSTEGLGYNTEKVGDFWLCKAPGGGDINGECQVCALAWLKRPVQPGEG